MHQGEDVPPFKEDDEDVTEAEVRSSMWIRAHLTAKVTHFTDNTPSADAHHLHGHRLCCKMDQSWHCWFSAGRTPSAGELLQL
jgi:hypothetical protein